ncbi:MAG: 16S rRNA (cytidine(1402)-2'-O)-methyltransferase [Gammaproteobacteria bacterium]
MKTGTLYVVATPVGNLDDLSPRALQTFRAVDLVAAEDTRHSKKLLTHFNISVPLKAYHDFNERGSGKILVNRLLEGKDIALISDAGTPLINDPGYRLVRSAHEHGIRVVPIPGPSAFVSALSVAGLPTDKFVFEGYPPEKHQARINYLQELKDETRTLVFYEAPHRIMGFLKDLVTVFGAERQGTVARELTKKFESVKTAPVDELLAWLGEDRDRQKGEFVVLLEGNSGAVSKSEVDAERLLELLLEELPLKKAATIVSRVTGLGKNELYQIGLNLQGK